MPCIARIARLLTHVVTFRWVAPAAIFIGATTTSITAAESPVVGLEGGRLEVRLSRSKESAQGIAIEGSSDGLNWLPAVAEWKLESYDTSGAADQYRLRDTRTAGSSTPRRMRLSARRPEWWNVHGKLINGSMRSFVAPGQAMTTGLVVAGGPVNVLARAAGPALSYFGLSGAHPDPKLGFSNPVVENDDWGGFQSIADAAIAVGAFPFVSPTSKDAALLASLPVGGLTAQITSADGVSSGIVLGEIYDLDASYGQPAARIVNFSTLVHVENEIIGGFVLEGNRPRSLLIRVIGPSLAGLGVPNAHPDPRFALHLDGEILATNDDWEQAQSGPDPLLQAFAQTGAFSLAHGTKDAAVLTTVRPGSSTVIVTISGPPGGVVLFEVYDVGSPVDEPAIAGVPAGFPMILAQPANAGVGPGGVAVLSVSTSDSALSCRWEYSDDGGGIWAALPEGGYYSGVQSSSLRIDGAPAALNARKYRAVLSNSLGRAISNVAAVTVNAGIGPASVPVPASNPFLLVLAAGASSPSACGASDPLSGESIAEDQAHEPNETDRLEHFVR
ncbi:MAG: hypothetical protein HC834_02295 [Rhodospirillales bacterium]|nr:hypothetical protein [Rhodospirillales bacterium]